MNVVSCVRPLWEEGGESSDVVAGSLRRHYRCDDKNRSEGKRDEVAEPEWTSLAVWNIRLGRRDLGQSNCGGQEHRPKDNDEVVDSFHETHSVAYPAGSVQGCSESRRPLRQRTHITEGPSAVLRSPMTQQQTKVDAIRHRIAVDVAVRSIPRREQDAKISAVNSTVLVEIGRV